MGKMLGDKLCWKEVERLREILSKRSGERFGDSLREKLGNLPEEKLRNRFGERLGERVIERLGERTCGRLGYRLDDWKYASRINKECLK